MKLPRAILFDLADTILVAFGSAILSLTWPCDWHRRLRLRRPMCLASAKTDGI
jgi:hypothetical protein